MNCPKLREQSVVFHFVRFYYFCRGVSAVFELLRMPKRFIHADKTREFYDKCVTLAWKKKYIYEFFLRNAPRVAHDTRFSGSSSVRCHALHHITVCAFVGKAMSPFHQPSHRQWCADFTHGDFGGRNDCIFVEIHPPGWGAHRKKYQKNSY